MIKIEGLFVINCLCFECDDIHKDEIYESMEEAESERKEMTEKGKSGCITPLDEYMDSIAYTYY